MTDERAKEIAEEMRNKEGGLSLAELFLVKLYDDIQALKQALTGLSFLGVGGGIKPVTKTDG